MPFDPAQSAMIALGKFYLHRWDKHVLADWAESMVAQDHASDEMHFLSAMSGDSREYQLDQFMEVCREHKMVINPVEELALEAYILNLRKRVVDGEIEPAAAFAQIRPLAYDEGVIVVSGLDELDQDLNLVDSGQPAFYNEDLYAKNKDEVIRRFFEELSVDTDPYQSSPSSKEPYESDYPGPFFDDEMMKYIEMVVIIFVTLVLVVWILLFLLTVVGGF